VTEGVILIFIRKFLVPIGYTPRLALVGQARPTAAGHSPQGERNKVRVIPKLRDDRTKVVLWRRLKPSIAIDIRSSFVIICSLTYHLILTDKIVGV